MVRRSRVPWGSVVSSKIDWGPGETRPLAIPARVLPARWKPSLRILLLLLGAVVLLPAAGLLGFGVMVARQNTAELWHQQSRHAIDRLADGVSNELAPIRKASDYLAALVRRGDVDPADTRALAGHLTAALAGLPQASDLAVIDTAYNVTVVNRDRQRTSRANWSNDEAIRRAVGTARAREESYWPGFFFAESARSTRLELHTPLRRDGRYLGLLVAVVTTAGLSRQVAGVGQDLGGTAFILSGHTDVVAHPRLTGPVPGLSDERPLPSIDDLDDPVLAGIWSQRDRTPHRYRLLDTTQSHVGRIAGNDHFYLYRQIDGVGPQPWLIGLHRPLENLIAPFRRSWLLLGAGLAAIVASAACLLHISGRLSAPVEELASRARRLARFDWSGPPLREGAVQEIDQASQAVNRLAAGLNKAAAYLPANLVQRLLLNDAPDAARSATRDITIMFTDIAGFSTIASGLSPARTVELLNAHFGLLVPCVAATGGTIDKFIGDGLMAFWGAPEPCDDHAERALSAALDIQAALRRENLGRQARGLPAVRIRIGLHSGPALVGTIGAPGRVDYTAVGDSVNVAQRLEGLARSFMGAADDSIILMSHATVTRIGTGMESFSLGRHLLPGHGGEFEIYRLA